MSRWLSVIPLIPTFLGNAWHNFYGKGPVPDTLRVIWRIKTDTARTQIGKESKLWTGIGWTGQPILFIENGKKYIVIGSLDHNLYKIDAEKGNIVWTYRFDDAVKITPTLYMNGKDTIIICGSRRGYGKHLWDTEIYSLRAINLFTGREVWRMQVEQTASFSRDCDGSAIVIDSIIGIGCENGIFYFIDPRKNPPRILKKILTYTKDDVLRRKYNLVIESSPVLLKKNIYITTGAGYLIGISLDDFSIKWKLYIGTDMDGSPVVTSDSLIIFTLEKENIPGPGGVMLVNPFKPPDSAVIWFFPVDTSIVDIWKGGVIGSATINEYYIDTTKPRLCAFHGVDGYLYIVYVDSIDTGYTVGPDSQRYYHKPKLVYKKFNCGSISTPIFVDDYLISCGYDGNLNIYKIKYNKKIQIELKVKFRTYSSIESTPIVWENKIYFGTRNGYIYCVGK